MAEGNTHLAKAVMVDTEIEEVPPWKRALFTLGKFVVGIAVGIAAAAVVGAILAGTALSGGLVAGVIVGVIGLAITMADTINADLNDDKPIMQKIDDYLYNAIPKSPCGKVAIGAKTVFFEGKPAANVHMTKADWDKFISEAEEAAKKSQERKDKWASGLGGKASVIGGHIKDMASGMAKGIWEGLKGPWVKPPAPPPDACQVACKNHDRKMFAIGSDSVFVEDRHPVVRLGDETECAAKPVEIGHAKTIIIGRESVTYKDIQRGSVWANFFVSAFTVVMIIFGAVKGAMKLKGKIKCARNASGFKNKAKAFWKDPIFAPNGSIFDSRNDFTIPNNLSLTFFRDYNQLYIQDDENGLGLGWKSSWGQKFIFKENEAYFYGFGDEEDLVFHTPHEYGESIHITQPHLVLECKGNELHLINKSDDTTRIFIKSKDGNAAWLFRHIDNLTQTGYQFYYDEDGLVSKITTTEGLEIVTERLHKRYRKIYVIENGDKVLLSTYDYDDNLQLTHVKSRQFGEFHYSYDEKQRLSSWGDSKYTLASYTYDDKNRCVFTQGAHGYHTGRFEYDEENRRTVISDEFGQNIIHYDESYNVTQHIDALGRIATYEYDENNLLIKSIAHNGQIEEMTYNDYGQVIAYKDSLDPEDVSYEYDENSRLIKVTKGSDFIELTRDKKGLITKEDYNGEQITHYKYNDKGQVIKTQNKGESIHFDYDNYNRLVEIKDKKYSFKQKHNIFSQVIATEDSLGRKEEFKYGQDKTINPRGELSHYINADGEKYHFIYDSEGLLESIKDADGISGKAIYGAFDTLMEIRMNNGSRYRFQYDSELRLTHVINPYDEEYIYTYDAVGRLIKEKDFADKVTQFFYNEQDLLIKKETPSGCIFSYEYDDFHQLIKEEVFDPSKDKNHPARQLITLFTYDKKGNVIKAQNNDSLTLHEYDDKNRIIKEATEGYERYYEYKEDDEDKKSVIITDNQNYRQEITYDKEDELKSIQVGHHSQLDFQFNDEGTQWHARNQKGFLRSESYSLGGKLQHQWAGHYKGEIKHFERERQKQFDKHLSPQTHVERSYKWSQASRLLSVKDHIFGEKQYGYTADNQVSHVSYNAKPQYGEKTLSQESFLYDKSQNISQTQQRIKDWQDNIKNAHGISSHQKHSYNKGGLVKDIIVGSGRHVQYHYDEHSRVIKKIEHKNGFREQIWHYEWDAKNRLIAVITPNNDKIAYRYDAFNRRIGKTIISSPHNGGKTKAHYAYAYQGVQIAYERKQVLTNLPANDIALTAQKIAGGDDIITRHWVYNSFEDTTPIAQKQNDALYYIMTDQVGMPKELLNEEGELLWAKEHSLWGKTLTLRHIANNNIDCNLRFPGQMEDVDTGLFYNYHRYYDSDTGQYLSPDPIGLDGGLRPQAYVTNPTTWIDFLGLTTYPSGMDSLGGFERHHIFPQSVLNRLKGYGVKFNIGSKGNLIYLPNGKTQAINKSLLNKYGLGKTSHKGFPQAHRNYNKMVETRLKDILSSNKSHINKLRDIVEFRRELRTKLANGDIDLTTKADGTSTIKGCK